MTLEGLACQRKTTRELERHGIGQVLFVMVGRAQEADRVGEECVLNPNHSVHMAVVAIVRFQDLQIPKGVTGTQC